MIKIIGIAPHPPIIIPEVGGERLAEANATVEGLRELCRRILDARPKRLIIITPHGPAARHEVVVPADACLRGDFGDFGAPQAEITFDQDQVLRERLEQEALAIGLPIQKIKFTLLDHGAAVPLYYLQREGLRLPGLYLCPGRLPYRDLYRFGHALKRALELHGFAAAVVASGDLSHRLSRGAPAGFSPRGADFDRLLVELLQRGAVDEILDLDENLVEEAGQCGLSTIAVALGVLDQAPFTTEIISYEGPFGVGYLTASLRPLVENRVKVQTIQGEELSDLSGKSCYAELAEQALRHYLERGRPLKAPHPLPPQFEGQAGVFVSIKMGGKLRGCIGTVEPVRNNLAEEIIANSISAGVRDPRFPPVRTEELKEINFSVDILSPMEKVNSAADPDPKRYGLLVKSGQRSGLLLPDLEGIDTVAQQMEIARRKAGILPGEPVELYRFTVTRHV